MLITIDLQSDVPIYMQLVNQVIEGMASGRLREGETLPSVRALAADLGINLHTVNKAYHLLKQEGFIQIHRQKGAVVQSLSRLRADDAFLQKIAQALRPLVAECVCRGMDERQFQSVCRRLFQEFAQEKSPGEEFAP